MVLLLGVLLLAVLFTALPELVGGSAAGAEDAAEEAGFACTPGRPGMRLVRLPHPASKRLAMSMVIENWKNLFFMVEPPS